VTREVHSFGKKGEKDEGKSIFCLFRVGYFFGGGRDWMQTSNRHDVKGGKDICQEGGQNSKKA
jgi:hypothetical protein